MCCESDLLGRKQRAKDLRDKKRDENPLRKWTEAEDKIIIEAQKKLGNKWVEISELLDKRTNEDVRNRWLDALDPEAKEQRAKITKEQREKKRDENPLRKWTEAEDSIIIENQKKLGNKWVEIAKLLNKRSNNDVSSRWYSALDSSSKQGMKRKRNQELDGFLSEPRLSLPSRAAVVVRPVLQFQQETRPKMKWKLKNSQRRSI